MSENSSTAATQPSLRGGAPAQKRELRAQGKRTIRKLLDAGIKVLESRGYHATRVDDIVKVAKTSHGTFYLYFANKEDLLRALIQDCSEQMEELAKSLGPVGRGKEGLRELREWLEGFHELYLSYGPVLRAWTEAVEALSEDFGRIGAQQLQLFSRTLATRIRAADPPKDVDPDIAAMAFVAMVERFHYLVFAREVDFDKDAVLDTLAKTIHLGVFAGKR